MLAIAVKQLLNRFKVRAPLKVIHVSSASCKCSAIILPPPLDVLDDVSVKNLHYHWLQRSLTKNIYHSFEEGIPVCLDGKEQAMGGWNVSLVRAITLPALSMSG